MDPIKIVVTNSDSTSVTSSTSYEQSQSTTELNKADHTQRVATTGSAAAAAAASLPASLSSTPTPHHHLHQYNNNGTKIKSINKRRNELPPLKLSTYEPKINKTFHLQVDNDHDVDDECRKLLLHPLVNKPFPSSQSTTSLNKRVTISSKSAFSRLEPSQSAGNRKGS